MTMVSRILALPTLEVMTPVHLEKATTIIISCLYAAIYAATASVISNAANGGQAKGQLSGLKEDDQDNLAALVVHKGIGLFDKLSQQIIKSTRSAGHVRHSDCIQPIRSMLLDTQSCFCKIHLTVQITRLYFLILAPKAQ